MLAERDYDPRCQRRELHTHPTDCSFGAYAEAEYYAHHVTGHPADDLHT